MTRAVVIAILLAACGGSSSNPGDDTPEDAGVDSPRPPDGWTSLLEGDWNLAAGEEAYVCVYATVPSNLYLDAMRPLNPPGTHHTVLTRYTGSHPDGTVRCNVGENGENMIYGSGVGAPEFVFPDGVGLYLPAGTRLLLNLHLYNATDNPLSGRSGTWARTTTAAEVPNLAELVLAGPTLSLRVPTGTTTQSGTCQISNIASTPVQVFALSQHMHKLGTNLRSVITRGAQQIELQNLPYDFEEQVFHLTPQLIEIRPGDTLTTFCSYDNTTGAEVRFGPSSDDEMCFTDLFYYPAQGASYICSGG